MYHGEFLVNHNFFLAVKNITFVTLVTFRILTCDKLRILILMLIITVYDHLFLLNSNKFKSRENLLFLKLGVFVNGNN